MLGVWFRRVRLKEPAAPFPGLRQRTKYTVLDAGMRYGRINDYGNRS
jgi:hypothetical protein